MGDIKNRNVPAGGKFILERKATRMSLISTTEPVNIVIERNHSQIETYKNVQAPVYVNFDNPFDVVKIESVSGAAQVINFGVTEGELRNPRSQGGVDIESSVPLSIKNQNSLDDAHFHGGWNFNAANFAHMQIFNPAASGIKLIIDSFIFSISGIANPVHVCRYNTALSSSTNQHSNKIIDGAVPAGQLRYVNFTGSYGNLINEIMPEAVNREVEIINDKNSPIILTEGKGILVRSQVSAASMRVRAEWEEIPA